MRLQIALLGLLVVASGAGAQLPQAWAQAGIGLGASGARNDYNDNFDLLRQLRVGLRLSSAYGVEVSGLTTAPIHTGDRITNANACVGPGGQPIACPEPTSFTISGAEASLVRAWHVDARLSLGLGSYVLSQYRTDLSSTRALGIVAGADFDIIRIVPRITMGVHPIYMPNVRGSNEWFLPIEAGIRF